MFLLTACEKIPGWDLIVISYSDDNEFGTPEIPPVQLPDYRAGDFFKFDNGVTYRVAAVNEEEITWMIGQTFTYKTLPSFLFPWTSWESEKGAAYLETDEDPDVMWPLTVGNSKRIVTKNFYTNKEQGGTETEYNEDRDCKVLAMVTVKVPAGTFDTFKIKCHRYVETSSYMGTRFYYYAPTVGHFVKQVDVIGLGSTDVLQLASYGISLRPLHANDRKELNAHLQNTLGAAPSGETSTWHSADGTQASSVMPTGTFVVGGNTYCRNYVHRLVIDGRERTLTGRACRNGKGVWTKPK